MFLLSISYLANILNHNINFSKMPMFILVVETSPKIKIFFTPSILHFNPLNAIITKWWNTLKQFVGNNWRVVWVCLPILWGWHLKGYPILPQYFIMEHWHENDQLFNNKHHKMIKHIQTICRQFSDELCDCVCPLEGAGA